VPAAVAAGGKRKDKPMTNKHPKHSMLTYVEPVGFDEINEFDDRDLATFIGRNLSPLDEDLIGQVMERWSDRRFPKVRS
jgi:hypothetical protein